MTLSFSGVMTPRHGENPHQAAAFYAEPNWQMPGVARATIRTASCLLQWHLINWIVPGNTSPDSASQQPVIKHNNVRAVVWRADFAEAFWTAHGGDPIKGYGGIYFPVWLPDVEQLMLITESIDLLSAS